METLPTLLQRYTKTTLVVLAQKFDQADALTLRKAELIDRLTTCITDYAGRETTARSLSPAQRSVLSLLLKWGGSARAGEVEWRLAQAGLVCMPGSCPSTPHCRPFVKVLKPLIEQGLVAVAYIPRPYGRLFELKLLAKKTRIASFELTLPLEIITALEAWREPLPSPPDVAIPPRMVRAAPPAFEEHEPYLFLRDALLLWMWIRRRPLRITRKGQPFKREIKRLRQHFAFDASWLETLIVFLLNWGFLIRDEGWLKADDAKSEFWHRPLAEQLAHLVETFTHRPESFYDLMQREATALAATSFTASVELVMRAPIQIRRALLSYLQRLSTGKWMDLEALYCLVSHGQNGGLFFTFESLAEVKAYLSTWYAPSLSPFTNSGSAVRQMELGFLRTLFEVLGALGLVALTRDDEGAITALSPTSLLTSLMAEEPLNLPEAPWQWVVQPNGQIVVIGHPPLSRLFRLERCCKLETLDERTMTYRLTREHLFIGFKQGETITTLRDFLSRQGQIPLPQNVVRTLEEWWTQYQRIRLLPHRLIVQVQDPALVELLLRNRRIAKAAYRPREDLLILPSALEREVSAILDREGYLPDLAGSAEDGRRGQLRIEGARFLPATPFLSLYLDAALAQFAEADGKGWRLTPESVRAAARRGMEAPQITAALEMMLGHPLPASWIHRIRQWSGHYGTVKAAEVVLLRFLDRQRLDDLLEVDPSLRPLIHPLHLPDEALAVVKKRDWAKVKAALQSLGIAFEMTSWW